MLTGLPFAAEAGLPLPALTAGGAPRFLLPRMKPEHRQEEKTRWAPFVRGLGFQTEEVLAGTWEGQGDVARFDDVTLMFFGGRTDREGLEAARHHVSGEVLALEIRSPAFHGNMAVLPLPHAGCLIVCADLVEDDGIALLEARFGRDRMHFVSMEEAKAYATNGLPLGEHVLAPTCTPPRVAQLLAAQGMRVEGLALVELCEKAGGASRCLVCVGEGLGDQVTIPAEARLDAWEQALS